MNYENILIKITRALMTAMLLFPSTFELISSNSITKTDPSYTFLQQKIKEEQAQREKRAQEKAERERKHQEVKENLKTLKSELEKYIATQEGSISITIQDCDTGEAIDLGGETLYFPASTIKVPMAMLIAEKISRGELSWQSKINYEDKYYEDGTGIMQGNAEGSYDVETLVKNSIVYSDNIAKNMLFANLCEDLNGRYKMIYDAYLKGTPIANGNEFSSNALAKILGRLEEGRAGNKNYEKIYTYMTQTIFHERLETSQTQGKVAHKIGSMDGFYHDMGIVSGAHPYIIVVLTSEVPEATQKISVISDKVYEVLENSGK